jgi:hypothetical protein
VRRGTTSGGPWTDVTTTAAEATSYSDTGLAAGTTYHYQVLATNGAGDSAASNEASATTWTPAESWRDTWFGQTANSGDAADDNDFDADGLANLLERAFGTNPTLADLDPSAAIPPYQSIVPDAGGDYLAITYRRLAGGTGTTGVNYGADGITYTVEYDGDLDDPWSTGSVAAVGSPVDNGDGTETVTVRLTTPVSAAAEQFIRLQVTAAP